MDLSEMCFKKRLKDVVLVASVVRAQTEYIMFSLKVALCKSFQEKMIKPYSPRYFGAIYSTCPIDRPSCTLRSPSHPNVNSLEE